MGRRTGRMRGRLRWAALAALAALLPALPALGAELRLRVEPERVRQGGVAAVRVEGANQAESLRVRLGGREIPLQRLPGAAAAVGWIGIDLEEAPGRRELSLPGGPDGVGLTVLDGRFPVQRLTLPRGFVDLDPATAERAARERELLDRLWERVTPERAWRGPFRFPLEGGTPPHGFGLRRVINGQPRSPHTGVDFAAVAGAAVLASNAGRVALSEEHFFGGQSVILDHGLGLYTMYFHLQERLVRPGQEVAAGEPIGRVGQTGRATGPHLHWGARLGGARIDPAELLRVQEP